jgi:hypothetical protein
MSKTKLGMIFFVLVAFLVIVVVHAQSEKQPQPKKTKQKAVQVQSKDNAKPEQIKPAVSEPKIAPVSIPQTTPFKGSRQGYKMVIDVLDGFGGESESDNYRIPVNSGGQPSPIGHSESTNYGVEAGFAYASHVVHGDANSDGAIGPGDIVALINYLYRAGSEPCPMESGDANCDGAVGPGDVVFLLNYLYRDGPPPPC